MTGARASAHGARAVVALAASVACAVAPLSARADVATVTEDPPRSARLAAPEQELRPVELSRRPTLTWMATQLIPSPGLLWGERGTRVSLGWQVTPLLWSWGTHRSLSPWRAFVVDPLARQSGSLELHASPEGLFGDRILVRSGVRAYLPIAHRGEYLSASVGSHVFVYDGAVRAGFDAGAYVLFGTVGALVTWAPGTGPVALGASLRLRYF